MKIRPFHFETSRNAEQLLTAPYKWCVCSMCVESIFRSKFSIVYTNKSLIITRLNHIPCHAYGANRWIQMNRKRRRKKKQQRTLTCYKKTNARSACILLPVTWSTVVILTIMHVIISLKDVQNSFWVNGEKLSRIMKKKHREKEKKVYHVCAWKSGREIVLWSPSFYRSHHQIHRMRTSYGLGHWQRIVSAIDR